jgi:AcrR family transcriptional regulator
MLDGAETVLREEGYGALTSRRLAEHIGVKQRLVYYYFETMDVLIVETFRRLASRELEQLRAATIGTHPLRQIWELCIHTNDSRMVAEFMALANRIVSLRSEVIAYIEEARALQVAALTNALPKDRATAIPPVALAIFASSSALTILREAELGVSTGHADVLTVIDGLIDSWGHMRPSDEG